MENKLFRLHLLAGKASGRAKTCGKKVNYKSEQTATNAATCLNQKGKTRGNLEPYPCFFCDGWHIGASMSIDVLEELASMELPRKKLKRIVESTEEREAREARLTLDRRMNCIRKDMQIVFSDVINYLKIGWFYKFPSAVLFRRAFSSPFHIITPRICSSEDVVNRYKLECAEYGKENKPKYRILIRPVLTAGLVERWAADAVLGEDVDGIINVEYIHYYGVDKILTESEVWAHSANFPISTYPISKEHFRKNKT